MSEPTDVVLVSTCDWANVGHLFQRSLEAVGVSAVSVAKKPHPFQYEQSSAVVHDRDVDGLVGRASTVINMHSVNHTGPQKGKLVGVFHGGTEYRSNPAGMNAIFNKFVDFSLIQTGELLNLGAFDTEWMVPPVDCDRIKPRFGITGEFLNVAHYPRDGREKGTKAILRALRMISRVKRYHDRVRYVWEQSRLPWPENLERMVQCDVYVESCVPTYRDREFGAWGMTALEAAALGKIVITNFVHAERYQAEFGSCPIQIANSSDEIVAVIKRLADMDRADLENLQVETREWVERVHSFEPTGKRLVSIFDKHRAASSEAANAAKARATGKYNPQQFWDVYGTRSWVDERVQRDEHTHILQLFARRHIVDGDVIRGSTLEVGQGCGNLYRFLKRHGVKWEQYRAVDIVNATRYRFREHTGILPDFWDGKALPYGDAAFDLVISADVMGYVQPENIDRFLGEHVRVCSQWLLVSTLVKAKNAHHFEHDYQTLWARHGLLGVDCRVTGNGTRRVWLLRKTMREIDMQELYDLEETAFLCVPDEEVTE